MELQELLTRQHVLAAEESLLDDISLVDRAENARRELMDIAGELSSALLTVVPH